MAAKCYAAEEDTEALGALYVQGQLQTDCTESYLKQMGVEAGRAGIRTGKSLLRAGDEWLKLRADVRLRNLYPVPISKTIETYSIAFARAWTGYDGSGFGGGSGEKSGFCVPDRKWKCNSHRSGMQLSESIGDANGPDSAGNQKKSGRREISAL